MDAGQVRQPRAFDGRVAIVTGAGQGLGRSHALGLAERGARVIVNDLGVARDGRGSSSAVADAVVEEIRSLGGEAIASTASVTDHQQVRAMVDVALAAWGRVDILVSNAGILRDRTFSKLPLDDFRAVVDVHLLGAVHCCMAVWPHMRKRSYGRIVNTTSSSGLYGNFGQSSYAAAKLGLVGLMNTLHLEGARYNIRVNCLAPCAATRMTDGLMTAEAPALLDPKAVSPGLLYLVSEKAPSRVVLTAGGGGYARAYIQETEGVVFGPAQNTPENIAARWDEISDRSTQHELPDGWAQSEKFMRNAAVTRGQGPPSDRPAGEPGQLPERLPAGADVRVERE